MNFGNTIALWHRPRATDLAANARLQTYVIFYIDEGPRAGHIQTLER